MACDTVCEGRLFQGGSKTEGDFKNAMRNEMREWIEWWAKNFATEKKEFTEQKTKVTLRVLSVLSG